MPTIERITPERVALFKSVRLQALLDAPTAFGSTYERESQLTDQAWVERAIACTGEQRVGYLAMDQQAPCGIIGAYLDEEDPQVAHLIMMWVAPSYRRSRVGESLVSAVRTWAESRGVRELRLMATSVNLGAIRFYEKIGFTMSGVTEPYPNDPAIVEYQMIQTLHNGVGSR